MFCFRLRLLQTREQRKMRRAVVFLAVACAADSLGRANTRSQAGFRTARQKRRSNALLNEEQRPKPALLSEGALNARIADKLQNLEAALNENDVGILGDASSDARTGSSDQVEGGQDENAHSFVDVGTLQSAFPTSTAPASTTAAEASGHAGNEWGVKAELKQRSKALFEEAHRLKALAEATESSGRDGRAASPQSHNSGGSDEPEPEDKNSAPHSTSSSTGALRSGSNSAGSNESGDANSAEGSSRSGRVHSSTSSSTTAHSASEQAHSRSDSQSPTLIAVSDHGEDVTSGDPSVSNRSANGPLIATAGGEEAASSDSSASARSADGPHSIDPKADESGMVDAEDAESGRHSASAGEGAGRGDAPGSISSSIGERDASSAGGKDGSKSKSEVSTRPATAKTDGVAAAEHAAENDEREAAEAAAADEASTLLASKEPPDAARTEQTKSKSSSKVRSTDIRDDTGDSNSGSKDGVGHETKSSDLGSDSASTAAAAHPVESVDDARGVHAREPTPAEGGNFAKPKTRDRQVAADEAEEEADPKALDEVKEDAEDEDGNGRRHEFG